MPQQSQGEESRVLLPSPGVALMRHLSPQPTLSSSSQADIPHYSESVIAPEIAPAIALLTSQITTLRNQITTLYTQIHEMQTRLKELEAVAYPINQRYRAPDPENTIYSPIVKLSFKAMKLLFLFLAGFAIAYILAGSLGASDVIDGLQTLISVWLMPLAALVFCTIAAAAIIESLK